MKNYSFVHFIGIGGISMSGIARVLLSNGVKVSGSDTGSSAIIDKLKENGAVVYDSHSADNITNQDLVVHTAAVKQDNPEIQEAIKKGIEVIDRAEMMGRLMKDYKNAVSVAGTHGKTTATSMMSYIMIKASLEPTVMVGGELDILGGNYKIGKKDYFITETCEYCRSFLKFFPTVAIILNVEEDHLDYYKDLDDIKDAFNDFARLVPQDGALIVCADDKNAMDCLKGIKAPLFTYGIENGEFTASKICYDSFGYPSFEILRNGEKLLDIKLNVTGLHNVSNAVGCTAAALAMGIDAKFIKEGLEAFSGTKRRFEKKGSLNGALIIDDYAHHPTEIEATLNAVKNISHKKLWTVFQPHTYTRTYTLFEDFKKVLKTAGNVIIADIYAAREKDTGLVSAKQLADAVENAVYIESFEKIEDYLKNNVSQGDIVLTVGAGNVVEIGEHIAG